ncbi:MAG: hypothetical protein PHV08_06950 [Sulfurovaceae bacterium]|nr:hypothetical protein [Sulfurovaceae bacterium]
MKEITVIGADMLHITDLMDNLQDQIDAIGTLMTNSSNEEILRISPLISSLGKQIAIIKDEFNKFIKEAENENRVCKI